MKAIVMAGGEGTRLRPITEAVPKPCAEVGGVPVLKRILEMLETNGTEQAVMTLMYLPHLVQQAVGNRYGNISLSYVIESPPLGTAGSVANAVDACQLHGEELVVISGDGLCDFDLSEAIERHRRVGAEVTILLTHREDPLEYGVVLTDEEDRVTGFVEKPDWSQATSELVNTGIYILSPRAVEKIPRGRAFDFAKDLFPLLLKQGALLLGVEVQGYWCDIGDPGAFLQANLDVLDGKVRTPTAMEGFSFDPHTKVLRAKTARVHARAHLERCVVGEHCLVGADSRLQGCVLMSGASVGEGCRLEETVVCRETVLENGVQTSAGCVIGPRLHFREGCRLGGQIVTVEEQEEPTVFGGVFGSSFGVIEAAELGKAVASLPWPVAAMGDGSEEADLCKRAFLCGSAERGTQTMDLGDGSRGAALFAGHGMQSLWAWFSYNGKAVHVTLGEPDGLSLRRLHQRKLQRAFKERVRETAFPKPTARMEGWAELYKNDLAGTFDLRGITISTKGKMAELLQTCGAEIQPLGRFRWEAGILRDEKSRRGVGGEWLALLPAVDRLKKGKSICVPADAPYALEDLAAENGAKVSRWLISCADDSDAHARQGAYANRWFIDEDLALIATLSLCRESSLDDLMEGTPAFFRENREVFAGGQDHMRLLRRLRQLHGEAGAGMQGVRFRRESGNVTVTPVEPGRFFVTAEAAAAETAQELCAEVCQWLDQREKK